MKPSPPEKKRRLQKRDPKSIIVRKRQNSEDKYDKVEYQERMEATLLSMLNKQFPVDDDDELPVKQAATHKSKQSLDLEIENIETRITVPSTGVAAQMSKINDQE